MEPINVVFDIDGVLACTRARTLQSASFFHRKGMIITALKTHYIFPGVRELMQLLFSIDRIRVSFFSSGVKERNIPFVRELLETSLGRENYLKVEGRVDVLSRDDLLRMQITDSYSQYEKYGLYHGNKKKDVSKVLREGE